MVYVLRYSGTVAVDGDFEVDVGGDGDGWFNMCMILTIYRRWV